MQGSIRRRKKPLIGGQMEILNHTVVARNQADIAGIMQDGMHTGDFMALTVLVQQSITEQTAWSATPPHHSL